MLLRMIRKTYNVQYVTQIMYTEHIIIYFFINNLKVMDHGFKFEEKSIISITDLF